MREMFPGYFRPTTADLTVLWSNCLFAIDANVILNLYRYSPKTRKALETAMMSVAGRIFLPHQAAKEFFRNRLGETSKKISNYSKAIKDLDEILNTFSDTKRHPIIENQELSEFSALSVKINEQLQSQIELLKKQLVNDDVLEFAASLFSGKVGNEFSPDELKAICDDGKSRYDQETPPGYKDAKKIVPNDPYAKFGDLIIWKEIIQKSKSDLIPVIFITDDKKEDWWLEVNGQKISPRPELIEEFRTETSNSFWMYTVDRFVQEIASLDDKTIEPQVISEIQEIHKELEDNQDQRNYFNNLQKNMSFFEKNLLRNMVRHLGIDSIITDTDQGVKDSFSAHVYMSSTASRDVLEKPDTPYVNGGMLTALRFLRFVDTSNELTDEGVNILKSIALELKTFNQ
jgi:hypothetical protein